ncbi:MAG: ROK family protein [Acidobacteriia bacterium]|nr:ROK family protein [Terriglobia bacterium]
MGKHLEKLAALAKPAVAPPLQERFAPAALANRAYRERVRACGRAVPLAIALERGDGSVSVYRTECFDERANGAELNLPYAERLVKFLLWQRGGWRVIVGGPRSIGEHIRDVYAPRGARAFDSDFMAGVYEHPFSVEITDADKVPEPCESTLRLGGHLEGCRIGFDLGATDRKVAAVIDGETVYAEEEVWDPCHASDPSYHFHEINAALKSAAKYLPRVEAIGGSAAGVYINNRPRVASLFRAVPKDVFDAKITRLFLDLQEAWGGVPFVVVNDGEVAALAGARSLDDHAVLGIALGSSQAGGYVTETGKITNWLNELAFAPVDYDPMAPQDEWSGDRGVGAQYFSQQAVFRMARQAGLELAESLGPAEGLKAVQEKLDAGDERARRIFESIGCFVGYGVAHYSEFYTLRHVLVLGRVTSGEGGSIILHQAQEVLRQEFAELAGRIALHLPDESSRRVGQAVAAASLPEL